MTRGDLSKTRSYLYQHNKPMLDELEQILSHYGLHPKTPITHKISVDLKILVTEALEYYKKINTSRKNKRR
jgi:hypothetical protein